MSGAARDDISHDKRRETTLRGTSRRVKDANADIQLNASKNFSNAFARQLAEMLALDLVPDAERGCNGVRPFVHTQF